jgi:hypothetical protein
MNDDFDDLTILQAASHIWRTPVKQKLLQDLSALSPSKRQPALKAKIFNLQNPEESPDEEEREEEERQEEEQEQEEREEEEREEEEQEQEEQEQEEQEEGERQPASTSPPTSPPYRRESSMQIRSDTPRGTSDGSELGTEDDIIKEAGALTKQRPTGSRVAALSGRPRWTMKNMSEAEKATRTIMFTALTLDYINEGPPPPDAERDSRLTNDSRMRTIIDTRYRQAYPHDWRVLEGIEIEGVIFPDRGSLTVGKAADVEL